jgi:hypothetical protein
MGMGNAAGKAFRPDRFAIRIAGDHGIGNTSLRQRGAGAGAAQGKIAAAFLAGTGHQGLLAGMESHGLAPVFHFRSPNAWRQDVGAKIHGDRISAKTCSSRAVKLSWSAFPNTAS